MKILLTPDKFKGSLSAQAVCVAIERGLRQGGFSGTIIQHPMADGGDGSLEVLARYLELEDRTVATTDPLGRSIAARYFTSPTAAFIEVASASGLVLLKAHERNPLKTSTAGTGILIADAIARGYRQIYLFLGGSATNDGGIGIATALGCQFLDAQQQVIAPIGENLPQVTHIKMDDVINFEHIKLHLLCDVNNPLTGKNGAAHIYAAQKGATPAQVNYLDHGLVHLSRILQQNTGIQVANIPGCGAAGGIGASLIALFGATIAPGFDTIARLSSLEEHIRQADWVISGEGKLDGQSLQGKVISGVATLCKKHRKPLSLLVGTNDLTKEEVSDLSAKAIFSISERATTLEDAMSNAASYLEAIAADQLKEWF